MKRSLETLGYVILTTIGLVLFLILMLNFYTMHNESITVPDITGKAMFDAKRMLEVSDLDYMVVDSTFDDSKPPLSVLEQNPKKGAQVKKHRKIYITLNASQPPSVKIPNIMDNSRRQAELILESWGLHVGSIIYIPDMAKDAVLGIQLKGKEVKSGSIVSKGSSIDLVLGDGFGNQVTEVPPLIGLTVLEARAVLDAVHLHMGALEADGSIIDTLKAYIYNQDPMYGMPGQLGPGNTVKLYITDTPVDFEQK
jgi:eukaryotic-like serine/threonine-protein kinase